MLHTLYPPPPPPLSYRFLPCCAKTVCSRLMKRSDFWDNYIGHHLKYFTIQSNLGCCHGNTFVKSGSLVKHDQNQQTCLKIKTAAIFNWINFSFGIFSEHLWLIAKSENNYLHHVTKIMTSAASFHEVAKRKCAFRHLVNVFK